MAKTWKELVREFPTIPYLFVGSGLSRRYLGLPTWETLLEHFAKKLSPDPFKFQSLKSQAENKLSRVGSLLEKEFNARWFSEASFRSSSEEVLKLVHKDVSPFKAELAEYVKEFSAIDETYNSEIELLKELSAHNIAGFITTNYDSFLENLVKGYKVYSSQEELIFSSIQGLAEIFKIHGSVTNPASIVITEEDYRRFEDKAAYLAAKLTTIFVEYPIIFIGYSLTDENIRNILKSIVHGLSDDHIKALSNRLIFVKRNKDLSDSVEVHEHTIALDRHVIPATQVETNDFGLVFQELKNKRISYPVRLLRLLREELYAYSLTNAPTKHCLVKEYDPSVPEDQLVCSIGVDQDRMVNGLVGISLEQWYRSILFDHEITYPADLVLEHSYPVVGKGNPGLPVCKYLSRSKKRHPQVPTVEKYDNLLTNTIRKGRVNKRFVVRTVNGVANEYSHDIKAVFRWIPYLSKEEIDVQELGVFLVNALSADSDNIKDSNFKRLIRIYDYLKFGIVDEKEAPPLEVVPL